MITIEKLREYGADVDEGLARCVNNEAFYLKLVGSVINDTQIEKLEEQLLAGDLDAAFETAHALKGMYANLSLTPIQKPVSEITDLLRTRTQTDYSALLDMAKQAKKKLAELEA